MGNQTGISIANAKYLTLMDLCRQRRFSEAYRETIRPDVPAAVNWNVQESPTQQILAGQGTRDDAESFIAAVYVRARICLEFRRFEWAIPLLNAAADAMQRWDFQPFTGAQHWARASAYACASRIEPLETRTSTANTPPLDLTLLNDDNNPVQDWLAIYQATSSEQFDDWSGLPERSDAPDSEQPELVGTWCRFHRHRVRANQADLNLREEALNYIAEAASIDWSTGRSGERRFDRILGFAPMNDNFLLHLALLHRQLGNYSEAIKLLEQLLDTGASDRTDGRCVAESVVAMVSCQRMYRRQYDKNLLDQIDTRFFPLLINESFIVDPERSDTENDTTHDLVDIGIRSSLTTAFTRHATIDPGSISPDPEFGVDGGWTFLHRQMAGVARYKSSLLAEQRPSEAYDVCVVADAMQSESRFFDGWRHEPTVRSLARPGFLLRMGHPDGALDEVIEAMSALGQGDAPPDQPLDGDEANDSLPQRLRRRYIDDSLVYEIDRKRSDWNLIRRALCSTTERSKQMSKVAMTILAAADLLRTVDRMSIAANWYDAMSYVPDGLGSYLALMGLEGDGNGGESPTDWYIRCHDPNCLSTSKPGCGVLGPSIRFLPLARALSCRWHMGQAREGLQVALDHFRYGSYDIRRLLETGGEIDASRSQQLGPQDHDSPGEYPSPPHRLLGLLPDELTKEIGVAYLQIDGFDEATQCFESLMQTNWELGAVSGVAGMMDMWRRRRELGKIRAQATLYTDPTSEAESRFSDSGARTTMVAALWAEIHSGDPRRARDLARRCIGVAPFDISAWLGYVRALRVMGDHTEAIDVLTWLLGDQARPPAVVLEDGSDTSQPILRVPEDPSPGMAIRHQIILRSELGWCYVDLDQKPDAARHFEMALRRGPRFVTAHRGLLNALAPDITRLAEERDRGVERALKAGPHGPGPDGFDFWRTAIRRELALEYGRLLIASRRPDDGIRELDSVMATTANGDTALRSRVMFAIINAYLDGDRLVEAEALIDELKRIQMPGQREIIVVLSARLMLAQGRSADAVKTLEHQVLEKSGFVRLHSDAIKSADVAETVRLAYLVALYENRQFPDVLRHLEELDDAGMTTNRLRQLHAWTLMAMSELPERADPVADVAKAGDISQALGTVSASDLHLRAMVVAQANRLDAGRPSKQIGPRDAGVPQDSNYVGSIASCFRYLEEATARRPVDGALYRDRAAVELQVSSNRRAEESLRLATMYSQDDARVSLLRGLLFFRRGDFAAAEQEFRNAVALDRRDPLHHRAHVMTLLRQHEYKAARTACKKGFHQVKTERRWMLKLLECDVLSEEAVDSDGGGLRRRFKLLREADEIASEVMAVADLSGYYWTLARIKKAKAQYNQGRIDTARRMLVGLPRPKQQDALEEYEVLMRHLDEGPPLSFVLNPNLWGGVVVVLLLLATSAWTVAAVTSIITPTAADASRTSGIDGSLLGVLLLVATIFTLVSVFRNQITAIRFQSAAVELTPAGELSEIVHTDLDLSASRLLLISGLSTFRPEVPFTDIEARFLASPQ